MFYQPPKTHKERLGQELTVTFLNDIILEDASPSEGLQAMLNSGALTHFTMNDEEILLRHLHKVVGDYVEAGEKRATMNALLPQEFSAARTPGGRMGHRGRPPALREAREQLHGARSGHSTTRCFRTPRKRSPTSTSSTTPNRCPTTSRTCATCCTR